MIIHNEYNYVFGGITLKIVHHTSTKHLVFGQVTKKNAETDCMPGVNFPRVHEQHASILELSSSKLCRILNYEEIIIKSPHCFQGHSR